MEFVNVFESYDLNKIFKFYKFFFNNRVNKVIIMLFRFLYIIKFCYLVSNK